MILVMGYRKGLARAIENRGLDYIIWNQKAILAKTRAKKVIVAAFPKSSSTALQHLSEVMQIKHVIAGSEQAVVPASKMRAWVGSRRNPHSTILRCSDKLLMKEYLFKHNIPMTKFSGPAMIQKPDQLLKNFKLPIVIKDRLGSGGRNIKKIESGSDLVLPLNKNQILEQFIVGKEGSIESLIVDKKIVFSNITEYLKPGVCNLVPSQNFSQSVLDDISELNRKVISSLKILWGITHLEYYVTKNGVLFGEVGIRPPGGYIMDALSIRYNTDFWDQFLAVELNENRVFDLQPGSFTSSYIIHPGAGVIRKIDGINEIQNLSSLKKFKLKIKPGDVIETRSGVGEDVGYAIFAASDRTVLLTDIAEFEKLLKITLE